MQISQQLKADLASATDGGFAEKPVVNRQPAVVVDAREHLPKAGGQAMHLLVVRLVGGTHDGVTIYDYQGINSTSDIGRNMSVKRLKQALAATGCAEASDTKAMIGQRLLVTTKERQKPDGTREVNVSKYEGDSGPQPAQANRQPDPGAPGFLRR